jgi:acetyl esterase/lipase
MSWQAALSGWVNRTFLRSAFARSALPEPGRRRFARLMRWISRNPPLTLSQQASIGGVPGLWVRNRARDEGVVLYFHGGAYVFGSPETHESMLAMLAARSHLPAFLADYRLAPEHPFPAAFEDAVAVWQGLLAQGYRPAQIVIGGDSAGGGLALALLAHLLAQGVRPAGLFAFSPWTDLTYTGASLVTNAAREQILPAHRLTEVRGLILGGARPGEANDPRLSPLHSTYPSAPPVLIHAAETEILRDDALRLRSRLPNAEIRIAGDLAHVWPLLHTWLPEGRETLDQTARFIRSCLSRSSGES